jgi:peptidoglycan hydrolase-like protein with peptidoglycan-binding domain
LSASNAAMTIGTWDPSKHPRAAAGSAGGGQFAPLSYNAKANTGTGYGKKGGDDRVKAAQKALNSAGMTDADGKKLVLDGKLGPKTTAAIKMYQRKHGIKPADGKITPALLKQLKDGASPAPGKGKTVHKKAALARKKGPLKKAPAAHRATPVSRDPAMR